jgi:hypothetical protein
VTFDGSSPNEGNFFFTGSVTDRFSKRAEVRTHGDLYRALSYSLARSASGMTTSPAPSEISSKVWGVNEQRKRSD